MMNIFFSVNIQNFSRAIKEEPKIMYEFKPAQRQASHAVTPKLEPGQYAVPNNKMYRRLMELQTKFTVSSFIQFQCQLKDFYIF